MDWKENVTGIYSPNYSYLVVGGPQLNIVRYESGVQKIVKNRRNLRDANYLDAGKQSGRKSQKIH